MKKLWLLTLALAACVSKPIAPPAPSALAFPAGTYQHKVNVQVVQPPRSLDLRGVIKSSPESLKVVGLSSFNTTVFRINENLKTGEIEKEFYVDAMKRAEDKFMFFYQLLKELQLAPKGQNEFDRQGAHFKLSAPDELGIPRKIEVTHPQVVLHIEVTSYEF